MADSGSSGPTIGEIVSESVVKPVSDEVGKMVEAGVQSITGGSSTQDPQEEANRKAEDERKRQNVLKFIHQMQADEVRLKQQRGEEAQKKQTEAQEESQENQVKQFDVQKKQANAQVQEKQRSMEAGKGKGVGG